MLTNDIKLRRPMLSDTFASVLCSQVTLVHKKIALNAAVRMSVLRETLVADRSTEGCR